MQSRVSLPPPAAPACRAPAARRERAARLADHAVGALVAEAMLTPKPALVDQRGSGAHADLDLGRLLCSARSLRGSFHSMARQASRARPGLALRERLGALGRYAEARMLTATAGSNAHRGAIWVLGLLVAARAMRSADAALTETATLAAELAQLPDRHAPQVASNGLRACARYGVRGARGEAVNGFPHVLQMALPMLRERRARGCDETCARLDALMAIMASLDDTCLLHRGGWEALRIAQRGARAVLTLGGTATTRGRRALHALDAELLRRYASPGGCADLLAACLFLDAVQRQKV